MSVFKDVGHDDALTGSADGDEVCGPALGISGGIAVCRSPLLHGFGASGRQAACMALT